MWSCTLHWNPTSSQKKTELFSATLVFLSALSPSCNQSSQIAPWAAVLIGPAQHPTWPQQYQHSTPVQSLIPLPNPSNSSPSRQDPATPSVNPCMPEAIWFTPLMSPLHSSCRFGWGLRAPCSDSTGGLAKRWLPLSSQWLNSSYILCIQISSLLQFFTRSMEMQLLCHSAKCSRWCHWQRHLG